MKLVKILKNEKTDESQKWTLTLLQPFLRLAYTTLYNKKETIFGASRKRLVFPINFSVLKKNLENIHQSGPRNWGKTVMCVPIYTKEQSDHQIKQVKTFLLLLRKAFI